MLLLRFARPKAVASLQPGEQVVIEGRVVPRGRIKILGTTVECVFHDTAVEEWRSGVRGGRAMWTPMRGEQELEPFDVEDETGKVLVWPEPAKVDVRGGRKERIQPTPGRRSVSRYIAPGDIVRVRGVTRVPPAPKSKKSKGKARASIEIAAPDGGKLVILFRRPSPPPVPPST